MKLTQLPIIIGSLGFFFWPLSSDAKFYKGYEIIFGEGKEFGVAKKFKAQKISNFPSFKKQSITNMTVPYDPRAKHYVFISTIDNDPQAKKDKSHVYRYNIVTHHSLRIASQAHKYGGGTSLAIEGIDGNELVLRVRTDNSPGPCSNYWKDGDEFKFLDIRSPKAGFKNYRVPQALIDQGDKEAKECRKESGLE